MIVVDLLLMGIITPILAIIVVVDIPIRVVMTVVEMLEAGVIKMVAVDRLMY